VLKSLVCDEGSGTMFFKMQVHGNVDGTETTARRERAPIAQ
jgi:hypothetical protein